MALLAIREISDYLDSLALQVLLGRQEQQVQKVLQVTLERQALQVVTGQQDGLDRLVPLAHLALLDRQDLEDRLAIVEQLALLVTRDLLD